MSVAIRKQMDFMRRWDEGGSVPAVAGIGGDVVKDSSPDYITRKSESHRNLLKHLFAAD